MRMIRPLRSLVPLLLTLALAGCASSTTRPTATGLALVSEAEGGRRWSAGPAVVLELRGSYRAMGRQYGLLTGDKLKQNHTALVEYHTRTASPPLAMTYARMAQLAESIYQLYPQRYQEMIRGMAETSGLSLTDQKILNAVELLTLFHFTTPSHCSGMAVWGPYTGGGPLVVGRNNDDSAYRGAFETIVTVLKPDDGSIPVATIIYAGVIYAATGINRDGLFLELNSGSKFGFDPTRALTLVTLLSFLQDYSTVEAVTPAFAALRVDMSALINAADPTGAVSFECPMAHGIEQACRRRAPDHEGVLVGTNHFIDPSWDPPFPELGATPLEDATLYGATRARHDNLLALADHRKGTIDAAAMMAIFDTPLTYRPDGTPDPGSGATFTGGPSPTLQTTVAIPKTKTLYLKVKGYFGWQKVELSDLLDRP